MYTAAEFRNKPRNGRFRTGMRLSNGNFTVINITMITCKSTSTQRNIRVTRKKIPKFFVFLSGRSALIHTEIESILILLQQYLNKFGHINYRYLKIFAWSKSI